VLGFRDKLEFMRRATKRTAAGCLLFAVIGVMLLTLTGKGRAVIDLWPVISSYIFPAGQQKYEASREGNLKAIYTGLMLYHDSEGQFPVATGWMDAIQGRIRATNMSPEEAQKKLVRPDLAPAQPGVFGYAMNDAVSGKYKGDIKNPKTVLIFESDQTGRNAHGNPANAKGRYAVAVDGTVTKI
jgi:hypothetical protein